MSEKYFILLFGMSAADPLYSNYLDSDFLSVFSFEAPLKSASLPFVNFTCRTIQHIEFTWRFTNRVPVSTSSLKKSAAKKKNVDSTTKSCANDNCWRNLEEISVGLPHWRDFVV